MNKIILGIIGSVIIISYLITIYIFQTGKNQTNPTNQTVQVLPNEKPSDEIFSNRTNESVVNKVCDPEMIKHRKRAMFVGIESSVLGNFPIIDECLEALGQIIPPQNPIAGGGRICSMDDIPGQWQSMSSMGDVRFQYRRVDEHEIIVGTEDIDIVRCEVGLGLRVCNIINDKETEYFICQNLL